MSIVQKRVGEVPERWRVSLFLVRSRDVELMQKLWPLRLGTLSIEIRERLESSFGIETPGAETRGAARAGKKRERRIAAVVDYPPNEGVSTTDQTRSGSHPGSSARAPVASRSGDRTPGTPEIPASEANSGSAGAVADHVSDGSDGGEPIDEDTLLMLRELDK